ncbi:MAG TPA: DUF3592 domain-containing protein [Acidobacteriaceae bacterium]|jgi:hypothetical protein|nr:DUF3592 domain-containing protein [Acidobacteriaceae bacterium]
MKAVEAAQQVDPMGGLVIDIYVAFIVKSTIRFFWLIRSSKWPRLQATIVRATRESDWCPILTLSYDFVGTLGSDGDSAEIPFLFSQTADQCAKRFPSGRRITIRVDPESERRTIVSLHDEQR